MKKLLFIAIIFTLTVACKQDKKSEIKTVTVSTAVSDDDKAVLVNYAKAEFTIEGMSCAVGCANTIEKNLNAMEGVKTATVSFEEKHATVAYDAAKVSLNDLERTVSGTGDGHTYTVLNMAKSDDKASGHACSDTCTQSCCADKKTE